MRKSIDPMDDTIHEQHRRVACSVESFANRRNV
jgi:hypothetical protein